MKAQTNAEAKSLAEIVHCRDCLYGQKFYTPPTNQSLAVCTATTTRLVTTKL